MSKNENAATTKGNDGEIHEQIEASDRRCDELLLSVPITKDQIPDIDALKLLI